MMTCRVKTCQVDNECPGINKAHVQTYAINAIWYCVVAQHLRRSVRIIAAGTLWMRPNLLSPTNYGGLYQASCAAFGDGNSVPSMARSLSDFMTIRNVASTAEHSIQHRLS